MTRKFALWLDRPYITVKRKEYTSFTNIEDIYVEPWAERVYVGIYSNNL